MPKATTTTTSRELILFDSSSPPVETGCIDVPVLSIDTEHPLDPELVVDPGPTAEIPISPGVQFTASSIINRLRHPGSVSTPGRPPGAQRPPRRKVISPMASSSGTGRKGRLATPSPSREMTSSPRAGSSSPAGSSSQPVGGPIVVEIEKEEIEISDDEEELNEDGSVRSKRKLTSKAWLSYKRVRIDGRVKARCLKCGTLLGGETKNGTSHLKAHNETCAYSKAEMNGKMMAQSSLRFAAKDGCNVSLENYVFDQELCMMTMGRKLASGVFLKTLKRGYRTSNCNVA